MRKHFGYLVCIGLLAGTLSGCGGGEDSGNGGNGPGGAASGASQGSQGDSGGSRQAAAPDLSTPELTFAHFKAAMENDTMGDALACMTPESQEMMLAATVFGVSMVVGFAQDEEKQKSLDALLAEQGVNMEDPEEPPPGTDQQTAMEDAMKQMVAGVEDKAACMNALMEWSKTNLEQENEGGSPLERIAQVELGEITIDGDTATAEVIIDGMTDENKRLVFTKVDGQWLIDMIATEEATGPPVGVE